MCDQARTRDSDNGRTRAGATKNSTPSQMVSVNVGSRDHAGNRRSVEAPENSIPYRVIGMLGVPDFRS
jgi:hypothetical protein